MSSVDLEFEFSLEGIPRFGLDTFEALAHWCYRLKGVSDIFLVSEKPIFIKKDKKTIQITKRAIANEEIDAVLRGMLHDTADVQVKQGEPQNFTHTVYGTDRQYRFRGNAYPISGQGGTDFIKITLRQNSAEALPPEKLGIHPRLVDLINEPEGLVLVTGPTNSGKTTTLVSIVGHAARTKPINIVINENPIESNLQFMTDSQALVTQTQVGVKGMTFGSALEEAMRQSPDIIYVGEIRNKDEMDLATQAASTGHLTFSTLHTNSVPGTLTRIVEFYPKELQGGVFKQYLDVLTCVVNQRLVLATNGKLVSVVSFLEFTTGVNRYVKNKFDSGSTVEESIYLALRKFGRPMSVDIFKHFDSGALDVKDTVTFLRKWGDREYDFSVLEKKVERKIECSDLPAASIELLNKWSEENQVV